MAGAATPVLAIAALVAVWACGLMWDSGRVLLDAKIKALVVAEILEVIDASPLRAMISDLRV